MGEIEVRKNNCFVVKIFEKDHFPKMMIYFTKMEDSILIRTLISINSDVVESISSDDKFYILNAINRKALGYSIFQPLPGSLFLCSSFVADFDYPQDALDNLLIATQVVSRRFKTIHDSFFTAREESGTFSLAKWREVYQDDGAWSIETKSGFFEGDTQEALTTITVLCAHTCLGEREVMNGSVQAVTPPGQNQILYFKGGDLPIIGTFCAVLAVAKHDEIRMLKVIADQNIFFLTNQLGHFFLAPSEEGFQINYVAYKHLTSDLNNATTLKLFMVAAIAEEIFVSTLKESAA